MNQNIDVTAIILAKKNDAPRLLNRTLASVAWCADRIIMLDAAKMPSDFIFGIKEYRARVICHQLISFADQRNRSLQLVQTPWTLFLDSDEEISLQLQDEIQSRLLHTTALAFSMHRIDVFMNTQLKHGETAHVRLLRLAKTHAGIWERPVHETWNIHGTIEQFDNSLLHTPHHSLASFLDKIDDYTTREAKYRKDLGVHFSWFEFFMYPIGKFVYNYFILCGVLDGFPGLAMAMMMSVHSLILRVKLYEEH